MNIQLRCFHVWAAVIATICGLAASAWAQENKVKLLQPVPWSYNDDPPVFWTPDDVVAEGKKITVPHPVYADSSVHLTLDLPDVITNGQAFEIVFTVTSDRQGVYIMEWDLFGEDSAVVDPGTNGVHLVKRMVWHPIAGQDWRWTVEATASPQFRDGTLVKTYGAGAGLGDPGWSLFAIEFGMWGPLWAGVRYQAPPPPPKISYAYPSGVPNTPEAGFYPEPLQVILYGADFSDGAVVSFGPGIQVKPVRLQGSSQLVVEISGYRNLPEGPREVTVTNPDGQKCVMPDLFFISSLVVKPIEINQGVPMACTPTQPGIADHNTVVRVKIECNGPGGSAARDGVTGWLHVTRDGKPISGSPFEPHEPLRVLAANSPLDRQRKSQAKDTLNFLFNNENALDEGKYNFEFEFDPRQPNVLPPLFANMSDWYRKKSLSRYLPGRVYFDSHPPTAIRIAVLVDGDQPADVADAMSYFDLVQAAYPINRSLVYQAYRSSNITYTDEDATMAALAEWLAQQANKNLNPFTHVILFTRSPALIDSGLSDCGRYEAMIYTGKFFCRSHAMVVKLRGDGTRDTVAHELGHNFLLGDTYQDPSQASENNPCDLAQCQVLGDGCPVEDGHMNTISLTVSTVVPAQSDFTQFVKRDFMGNAVWPLRWVDRRTWDYLYGIFNPPVSLLDRMLSRAPSLGNEHQEYIRVAGIISTNGSVALRTCHRFAAPLAAPALPLGPYAVELQDANGQRLSSTNFLAVFGYAGDQPRAESTTHFSVTLPYPPATARILVKKDGRELAARPVSAHPPTVRVLAPNGGESLSGPSRIHWTASDGDGDPLTYTVFYSRDGVAWDPLAVAVTGTNIAWDTRLSPGSSAGRIRVVANDGVNSGSDDSDGPFMVASKAPLMAISPQSNISSLSSDLPILLQGSGYDMEDGVLPDAALTFRSDRGGVLGHGRELWVKQLSLGTHVITLEGVDTDNQSASTSITLTVNPPSFLKPILNIVCSHRVAVISWPAESSGYQLQSTPALVSGLWRLEAVTATNQISIPATNPSQFFRLLKPSE